jgi:hypothetical protein
MADALKMGFETMCLHAGYSVHGDENVYGLGKGAPRGVPLHKSSSYQVRPRPCVIREIADCIMGYAPTFRLHMPLSPPPKK